MCVQYNESFRSIQNVANQNADESKAVDECGGGAHEEGRQALRDRLLQEQSSLLAVRRVFVQYLHCGGAGPFMNCPDSRLSCTSTYITQHKSYVSL